MAGARPLHIGVAQGAFGSATVPLEISATARMHLRSEAIAQLQRDFPSWDLDPTISTDPERLKALLEQLQRTYNVALALLALLAPEEAQT